eukprot:4912767-Amphidinium_carterae.1
MGDWDQRSRFGELRPLRRQWRKVDDELLGPDLGFQTMQGMSRQGMTDVIRGELACTLDGDIVTIQQV